jgi:hypothetical protein
MVTPGNDTDGIPYSCGLSVFVIKYYETPRFLNRSSPPDRRRIFFLSMLLAVVREG